jgi:glycosyltransferase involved in cell wall biosynthesis
MKIAFLSGTPIPCYHAESVFTLKMAQALIEIGHEVHLMIPEPEDSEELAAKLREIYALRVTPTFQTLKATEERRLGRFRFAFEASALAAKLGVDLVYSRHIQASLAAVWRRLPTIHEIHQLPLTSSLALYARLLNSSGSFLYWVALTESLAYDLRAVAPSSFENIPVHIVPDGVDLQEYRGRPSRSMAKSALSIPAEAFVVGYCGSFGPGRGLDLVRELINCIELADCFFLVVGGHLDQVEELRNRIRGKGNRVLTPGYVPNFQVPRYLAACDLLLLPNRRPQQGLQEDNFVRWTSPMKLFEYLAIGGCIVASDLPVIREILNRQNCRLCSPHDLEDWKTAILELRDQPETRRQLEMRAAEDALRYDWKTRASRVLGTER